jgi:catechol 2,3-dioxygenase-like lactoylglutathione lyase family enzyme
MLSVCIVCNDFDKSFDFYTRVLRGTALEVTGDDGSDLGPSMGFKGTSNHRAAMIHWGTEEHSQRHGPYLDLLEWTDKGETEVVRTAKDTGLARLIFGVDDIEETAARLEANGVVLNAPINTAIVGRWELRACFFPDPDGNLLECIEVVR